MSLRALQQTERRRANHQPSFSADLLEVDCGRNYFKPEGEAKCIEQFLMVTKSALSGMLLVLTSSKRMRRLRVSHLAD